MVRMIDSRTMSNPRVFLLSTMCLAPGKIRRATRAAREVGATIDGLLAHAGMLAGAPFTSFSLVLVFGRHDADAPTYQPVGEEGELPLALELDTTPLERASGRELHDRFLFASLTALRHAGQKYGLDVSCLERLMEEPGGGQAEAPAPRRPD